MQKKYWTIERKLFELRADKVILGSKFKSLDWKDSYKDEGLEKHSLYIRKEEALIAYNNQKKVKLIDFIGKRQKN